MIFIKTCVHISCHNVELHKWAASHNTFSMRRNNKLECSLYFRDKL